MIVSQASWAKAEFQVLVYTASQIQADFKVTGRDIHGWPRKEHVNANH
jgi:hypothetical protein